MNDERIWSMEDHKQKSQGKIRFELMANNSVEMEENKTANSYDGKAREKQKKMGVPRARLNETKANVQHAIQNDTISLI